ncbi:MAG: amphi-Trp domain-containing protein [Myxococcales bacterium]|nr:amphi-Trp domain-containing protein [Myxococcales bacterium]
MKNAPPAAPDAKADHDESTDGKIEANNNMNRNEARKPMKIGFESDMALEEAVTYFEAIVNGLRKRAIEFRRGGDALSLTPASQVHVEVKASGKERKEKVTFELSWGVETPRDFEIS